MFLPLAGLTFGGKSRTEVPNASDQRGCWSDFWLQKSDYRRYPAWKQVIGDGLHAHTGERRATEVDVAAYALKCMLELGRPSYVRTA